jgi:hypothetical protein
MFGTAQEMIDLEPKMREFENQINFQIEEDTQTALI